MVQTYVDESIELSEKWAEVDLFGQTGYDPQLT